MADPVSEARALLAATGPTPGEPNGKGPQWRTSGPSVNEDGDDEWLVLGDGAVAAIVHHRDDAALIAAAPDLLARLCDEVERLRAENLSHRRDLGDDV